MTKENIADELDEEIKHEELRPLKDIINAEKSISNETLEGMSTCANYLPTERLAIRRAAKKLSDIKLLELAEKLNQLAGKMKVDRPHGYTKEERESDWEKVDTSKELPLLNIRDKSGWKLTIPSGGSFNVIGARPGCGKTTALISIAAENLFRPTPFDKIAFISLEESKFSIFNKIVCNYLHSSNIIENNKYDEPKEPMKQLAAIHGKNENLKPEDTAPLFKEQSKIIEDILDQRQAEGKFDIHGADFCAINELENVLAYYENSLILLDYTQYVESDGQETGYKEQKVNCKRIARIARECGNIVVAGAQLNRNGLEKGVEWQRPENMNDTCLRESDDILCAADTIVFNGRLYEDKLFWKVMKVRNSEGIYRSGMYDSKLSYFYLQGTDEPVPVEVEENEKKSNTKKKKQNNGKIDLSNDPLANVKNNDKRDMLDMLLENA